MLLIKSHKSLCTATKPSAGQLILSPSGMYRVNQVTEGSQLTSFTRNAIHVYLYKETCQADLSLVFFFSLTERHVSTHPGEGERFPAGQSKLPERPSHSADPRRRAEPVLARAACLEDPQVCLFQLSIEEQTPPSWEKWGSR